jgi:hypothetical protein
MGRERAEARATARQNAPKGRKVKVDQSQCKKRGAIVYNACRTCFVKSERSDLQRCGRCQNVWYCSPCVTRRISSTRALISRPARARRNIGQPTRRLAMDFDPESIAPEPVAPDQFIGCPRADPTFIRTPALWRQIWYLNKPNSQYSDYHVRQLSTPSDRRG